MTPPTSFVEDRPELTDYAVSKRRVWVLWAALAGVAIFSVYGILANKLFSQVFWVPSGLRRMAGLAAAYAIWSAIFLRFAPRWFFPATTALFVAAAVAGVWPLPVVAVLFFLFACYVTGAVLLPTAGARDLTAGLLQFVLGLAVWMAVTGVLVHFPVNYRWVYVALLAIPCAVKPKVALACLRDFGRAFRPAVFARKSEYCCAALLAFPLLCQMLLALKPEAGADALAMHLVIPAWVDYRHFWHFDFRYISWALMPMGADWCYTAAYLLGGEFAARLLNFAAYAAICALVFAVSERHAGRGPAFFFAALFASSPLVTMVTGSLFVENIWALVLFGAVVALSRYRTTADARMLYLAGILLGAGMATKFGALAFLIPVFAAMAWASYRNLRTLAIAAALLVLFGAGPYAYAWWVSGNPVFPFFNEIFKSRWFDAVAFTTRYSMPLRPIELYQAVFQTHMHLESRDGGFGFQVLFLLALGVAGFARKWPYLARLSFAVAIVFSILTFAGQAYVRYIYPALPLLSVTAAIAFVGIEREEVLRRAFLAVLLAAFALNLYFLPSSCWQHGEFFLNPFSKQEMRDYVSASTPVRRLIFYMNRVHPGEPVAFFETGDIAGLRAKAYTFGWHNRTYSRQAWTAADADAYGKLALSLGLKWFLAPAAWASTAPAMPVHKFLLENTDSEYRFNAFEIRKLTSAAETRLRALSNEVPLPPCEPGIFDDPAPQIQYSGKWRPAQIGQACGGTLTYTDAAGAEALFRFYGTGVTYVYTKAYTRGSVEVFIDGKNSGVIDQFSTRVEWRARTTYGGLPLGNHAITIRARHAKAAASQGFDVDVDGFVVR